MRNHDEILQEAFENNVWPEDTMATFMENDEPLYHVVAQAIRQAQIEAIEECAEVGFDAIKSQLEKDNNLLGINKGSLTNADLEALGKYLIGKSAILKLKNQVK